MPSADLAQYLLRDESKQGDPDFATIDLIEIPAKRRSAATIHLQASLQEAHEALDHSENEALCVVHRNSDGEQINGVLTQKEIEAHYHS